MKNTILVFCPTPNEYASVKKYLSRGAFKNFSVQVVESGPGKINAAFKVASEVASVRGQGGKVIYIVGCGTSGSLNAELKAGDMIASRWSVISDWIMRDDKTTKYGSYGTFVYDDLANIKDWDLRCTHKDVIRLMDVLNGKQFKIGRMMTSDIFVAGKNNKLKHGLDFESLACDMESGAFAYAAGTLLDIPWFHLRVVADTLDDSLADYFNMEQDMVDILGAKALEALETLDSICN